MKLGVKSFSFYPSDFFNFLMCVVLFTPEIFKSLGGTWNTLYIAVGFLSLLYIIVQLPFRLLRMNYPTSSANRISFKNNSIIIVFLCFALWLIISDLVARSFNVSIFLFVSKVFCFYLMLANSKQEKKIRLLSCVYFYCYIIILINVLTQFMYPKGIVNVSLFSWQNYYFLKNANSFIFFYLFTLSLGCILSFYSRKRLKLSVYILVAIEIISYLKEGAQSSTTGFIIIVLSLLLNCLLMTGILKKIIRFITKHFFIFLIVITAIFLSIIFSEYIRTNIILPLISHLSSDEFSFEARIYIWNYSIQSVLSHPFFGLGTSSTRIITSILDKKMTSSHNNYLQIAVFAGFPALALFISFIVLTIKKIYNKNQLWVSSLFIAVFLFMIVFLVEQNPFNELFFYLALISLCVDGSDVSKKLPATEEM